MDWPSLAKAGRAEKFGSGRDLVGHWEIADVTDRVLAEDDKRTIQDRMDSYPGFKQMQGL